MDEIVGIVLSWQFLAMGVLVAFIMTVSMKVGAALWKLRKKWLRQAIRFCHATIPWAPGVLGGAIGAIPYWPRPGQLADLSSNAGYFSMIVLGIIAGSLYERIWKGVKQAVEMRGIKLDSDDPPAAQ